MICVGGVVDDHACDIGGHSIGVAISCGGGPHLASNVIEVPSAAFEMWFDAYSVDHDGQGGRIGKCSVD